MSMRLIGRIVVLLFLGVLSVPYIALSSSLVGGEESGKAIASHIDATLLKEFLLAILGETVEKRRALAAEAIAVSNAVLDKDQHNLSAHMIMIAGLGAMARGMSPVESVRERYGWRSREFLEKATQLAPNDAWVHALYGTWHLEVTRRSKIFGPLILGADRNKGIEHFEKALRLDQQDPLLPFAFCVSLISLDDSKYSERVLKLLDRVISSETSQAQVAVGVDYAKVFQEARVLYQMITLNEHPAVGERARNLF